MKYFSVDRIEEDIAVLLDDENNSFKENLTDLPNGISEGTVLIKADGKYRIDEDEEDRRRKRISALQDSIFGE